MSIKQAVLDRVRVFNKHVTNKVLMNFAGGYSSPFSILRHYGRKTGKKYRIPVIAVPAENGFIIALTYGKKTDWYKNVKARGECVLKWKDMEFYLHIPRLIDPESALRAFPAFTRSALRFARVQYFLHLTKHPKA
jgi:deazaflavin-dependent oxidoreductase (nitroreductase family)